MRQDLYERQRTAQVEQSIGAAEPIRDHRPGQNNGLILDRVPEPLRGLHHGVSPMSDDDFIFLRASAILHDDRPVLILHAGAIQHHQGTDVQVHFAMTQLEHLGEMRVTEEEFPFYLIVFLVECPAGDKYLDCHRFNPIPVCIENR